MIGLDLEAQQLVLGTYVLSGNEPYEKYEPRWMLSRALYHPIRAIMMILSLSSCHRTRYGKNWLVFNLCLNWRSGGCCLATLWRPELGHSLALEQVDARQLEDSMYSYILMTQFIRNVCFVVVFVVCISAEAIFLDDGQSGWEIRSFLFG